MLSRRVGIVGASAATVLLTSAGAYAAGNGANAGGAGVVVNTATVGGVTFTGSCQYALTSRLTMTGAATAVSATPVSATSITCTVEHASPVPATTSSSGWTTGPAAATDSIGGLQVRGTAICITMSAEQAGGSVVSTGPFCAS